MHKRHIAIIGSGNMGTALAQVIAENGWGVKIWGIEERILAEINSRHTNKKYLSKIKLSKNIRAVFNIPDCVNGAEAVFLAVPSRAIKGVVKEIKPYLKTGQLLVNTSKGLEEKTGRVMHEVILNELGYNWAKNVVVISGPSVATEFVRKKFAVVIAAAGAKNNFKKLRKILATDYFKVIWSNDLIGTELGGALKNIYAIAMGMCDGMDYTNNTQIVLAVEALEEMKSIYRSFGANTETVYSLAGLGDFLATSLSEFSRNRTLGELICVKGSYARARKSMEQVTEGVVAVKIVYDIAKKRKLKLPLLELVYRIIYKRADPCRLLEKFLRETI
ncbi:MAG: NAD(P)H-dependent glycerol-3-phosphate dehydrogenase [Patescibacteria group bacterium]|nr:NAD(P)H-dependent glycerol-3-phosphate dehydrogenase [Patescibacteria group bacterium]MDD5490823.1 NAD(P)H-dependent glycerol-3-phosphate dehydrogenase [Patescibacteria group bacterium]